MNYLFNFPSPIHLELLVHNPPPLVIKVRSMTTQHGLVVNFWRNLQVIKRLTSFSQLAFSVYLPVVVQSQLAQLWPQRARGHAVYGYCDNENHKDPSVLAIFHFELDEFLLAHSMFP